MYNKLFSAWRYELENEALGSLETNFYSKISNYIKSLKEKNEEFSTGIQSSLLTQELNHAICMVEELISTRYNKIINLSEKEKSITLEILPLEERNLFSNFFSFIKKYQLFKKKLLNDSVTKKEIKQSKNRIILRFLQDVPRLIGTDMNSYGPFLAEDVASLPSENAELLIKKGLGKIVETE